MLVVGSDVGSIPMGLIVGSGVGSMIGGAIPSFLNIYCVISLHY